MLAMIQAVFEGLAAIPKLIKLIEDLQISARLSAIESRQAAMNEAFNKLAAAKTPEDIQNAAHSASKAWNG